MGRLQGLKGVRDEWERCLVVLGFRSNRMKKGWEMRKNEKKCSFVGILSTISQWKRKLTVLSVIKSRRTCMRNFSLSWFNCSCLLINWRKLQGESEKKKERIFFSLFIFFFFCCVLPAKAFRWWKFFWPRWTFYFLDCHSLLPRTMEWGWGGEIGREIEEVKKWKKDKTREEFSIEQQVAKEMFEKFPSLAGVCVFVCECSCGFSFKLFYVPQQFFFFVRRSCWVTAESMS